MPDGGELLSDISLLERELGSGGGSIHRARIRACGRVVSQACDVAVRARGGGALEILQTVTLERHERDHEVGGVTDR